MKNLPYLRILVFACIVSWMFACKKGINSPTDNTDPNSNNPDVSTLQSLTIPASFNFETAREISLDITLKAPDNSPIGMVPVRILNKPEEAGGKVLYKGLTDANGKITGQLKLPAHYSQLIVDPRYLGIMRNATVQLVNDRITCTLGGSNGYAGNVIPDALTNGRPGLGWNLRPTSTVLSYMGTYNSSGKPNYLMATNDTISAGLLADINASLPERQPVPTYHPDYLTSTAKTNLEITALSDVWFTFVTEGAGYTNSIGYYVYNTGSAPSTASNIDSIHVILPNASLSGSGGSLVSGNRVYLGRFPAGKTIGFVLIANGWNGTSVGSGIHSVYSDDHLNSGSTAANRRQTVLLWDNSRSLFMIGFEDIQRESSGCDHDFNDAIFFVKSNPVTGISKTNVNPMDRPVDSDGDGVNDTYDDFPNDASKAYLNYYPSATEMGVHAFEDNWPYLGDYDVNDLVVGYRYKVISNAQNKPVEMTAKYVLQASGATFKNGFGVQFPFSSSLVQSATGSIVANSQVVSLGANGCENGQSKAVIIPFDDAFAAMNTSNGFINTYIGAAYLTRDTITMNITFTRGLTLSEFGTAPFNPFIIINRTRGREAHLSGYPPTDLVDTRYFRTGADNTNTGQSRYYKTASGLPWGIGFSESFNYPAEGKAINTVYTNFVNWATSGGSSNANWYKDTANTVQSRVYHH